MCWRLCFSGQYTAMTHQDWLVMAISRKSIFLVPNVRQEQISLLSLGQKFRRYCSGGINAHEKGASGAFLAHIVGWLVLSYWNY